jgi:hypothetical protein
MNHVNDEIAALNAVCDALSQGNTDHATRLAQLRMPFSPFECDIEKYSKSQSIQIFLRDGFIDRYSGQPFVFTETLRLLSKLLPAEFPFHSNWEMTRCHFMYWKYFPTIDHLDPRARGGGVNDSNLMTTSMLRNSAKSNWTLDELEWKIYPSGELSNWDGLTTWFLSYTGRHPTERDHRYLREWYSAAKRALNAL